MSYYTYFRGELNVALQQPHLNTLKEYITTQFKGKNIMIAEENFLKVSGEWKDNGLMLHVVQFIKENGQLNSGRILCEGEDFKDIWEIVVSDKETVIRELGKMETLYRAEIKKELHQTSLNTWILQRTN